MVRQRGAHGVEEIVRLAEDVRLEAALMHRRVEALQQAGVGQDVRVVHDAVRGGQRQLRVACGVLGAEGGPCGPAAAAAAGASARQHCHRVRVRGDFHVAEAVAVRVAVSVIVATQSCTHRVR